MLSSYFRKELKGKYFKVNILLVSFVLLTNNPHISVDDQNTGLFLTHATSWTQVGYGFTLPTFSFQN